MKMFPRTAADEALAFIRRFPQTNAMPETSRPPAPPSPAFAAAFHEAAGPRGELPFDRFVELALYHPELGYYRRNLTRVGYRAGTDFFTASSVGPFFGELLCAALKKLSGDESLSGFEFVEIGAEPGDGVLNGVAHPFARVRTIRVGEPLSISGRSIVFSNELFDAQPFRRFVRREEKWRELGVRIERDQLLEIVLDDFSAPVPDGWLPPQAPDGYTLDAPLRSVHLAEEIAAQPWDGWFLSFDYGKNWRDLSENYPAGTARAYSQHRQSNDLLASPGEQDLTCHVCWDFLVEVLSFHHFAAPKVEWQESFFVHHAGDFIEATLAAEAGRISAKKRALLQLLHPAQMGQKFQVLFARRTSQA